MAWITPKTDWTDGEFFDKDDFNRIIGNIDFLYNLYTSLGNTPFTPASMGTAVTTYSVTVWNYAYFNNLQTNINTMYANIPTLGEIRDMFTYSENGAFCTADELNYIENSCIDVEAALQAQIAGIRRIPFKLGQYKTRI